MALFIGGPLDGQLVEVGIDRDHVEVAVNRKLNNSKLTDIFFYKKEVLECPTVDIPVFVPRNFSCSDVIAALIESYHQNAQREE